MQENSIEWFDSLLESVLDFGLFSSECDDRDIAVSAEGAIVVIDYIRGVFIVCLIVDGMDNELLMRVSYFIMCSLVSAVIIDC